MDVKRNQILSIAFSGLVVGVIVYVFDRQSEFVYFLPDWFSVNKFRGGIFGSIGYFLPTFIHVYVFILLTATVSASPNKNLIPICISWFIFDSLFEIGQIHVIAQSIANHVPAWFSDIPILNNTSSYFLMGTFDVLDLISIALGTICAYLTITFVLGRT